MNEKKNLTTEETFALAVQNHQKNNLYTCFWFKELLSYILWEQLGLGWD